MAGFLSFLWLTYILLYYHFFIHSFTDGHVGSFHILAIVNNVAIHIGVHISFQIKDLLSLGKFLEVELLHYMVFLFFIF